MGSRGAPALAGALALTLAACGPRPAAVAPPASAPASTVAPARATGAPTVHEAHPGGDPTQLLFQMGPCHPDGIPLGAIPPAPRPAWCATLPRAASSARAGDNTWVDTFEGQTRTAAFPSGYAVFEAARDSAIYRTKHFIHAGHWMVDAVSKGPPPGEYFGDARDLIKGLTWGGGLVRPDQAFRAVEGRLIVEADVSAAMQAYRDGAWPEILITTAAKPTGIEVDPLHASGIFGGAPTIGCQLYPDRKPFCRVHGADGRHYRSGGLVAELSGAKPSGAARQFGGDPNAPELAAAWRVCEPTDPDAKCRDRFRLEVSSDTVRLLVNGTLYMEHAGLPAGKRLPDELFSSDVYVYFASWIYLPDPEIARMHWGRIAVNP